MAKINEMALFASSFLKERKVVLLLLAVGVAILALVYFRVIKNPLPNVSLLQKSPKVSIETEYKNPFDKKTQYVNPFETYKNPFVVAK